MQRRDTHGYFARRADQERIAAAGAGDERAAQCHRDLADRYEAMSRGPAGAMPADEPPLGILHSDFRILP